MYKPFLLDAIKHAKTPPHRVGKVTRFNRVVEHAANEYIREHYPRKIVVGCEHTAIHYGLPIGSVYHDKLYLLGMGTEKGRIVWAQTYKGMRSELRRMIEDGEFDLVGADIMPINREKAKKVRLPLYWVGHVISYVFGGAYTHHYRDADNNLTFVVQRDSTDWSQVFPSARVTDVDGASVVWIVFEKNKRHWHYAKKEA